MCKKNTDLDWDFNLALIALIFGALAMGSSPLFVRFAASEVGPFASAFWRLFLALPILYIWMKLDGKRKNTNFDVSKKNISKYSILAGFAFAFDLFFWHLAILNTSVTNATFFATLTPIYIIAITYFIFKQNITRAALFGVILCLIGGGFLLGQSFNIRPESVKGDIYGLITAFFFSLYILALAYARKDGARAAKVSFQQALVACAVLFFIAVVHSFISKFGFFPHSSKGILSLLLLAIISQVLGQGLLAVSLGCLPTVFSSLVIFLEAVAAALLGFLFLDERILIFQCIGGFFILAGIFIARPKE